MTVLDAGAERQELRRKLGRALPVATVAAAATAHLATCTGR
jgi:hypothetical protein